MTYQIISDTHFNHKLLLDIGPFSRPKNYEKLIKNNLAQIKKTDTLVLIGDVCIGKDAEIHKRYIVPLKCRKVLVLGNHDRKSIHWYLTHGRDEVHRILLLTDDLGDTKNRGNGMMQGRKVLLTHQPLLNLPEGFYNIHGHYHDRPMKPFSERHFLYSPEKENYKPRTLESFF